MIIKLMRVELLKVRRSLALMMMFACPLMVALLMLAVELKSKRGWSLEMFWASHTAVWCYFMYPLYIALVTGLLNGNEHKNATWRVMLTMPVSARQLYVAKLLLALCFIIGANLVLVGLVSLSAFALRQAGHVLPGTIDFSILYRVLIISLAGLPIVVAQHWVSWRVQNIVAPLALGVIATMGITQIGQSKEWVYYPWTYAMTSIHATSVDARVLAVQLALAVGAGLFLVSTLWVGRRGAEFA